MDCEAAAPRPATLSDVHARRLLEAIERGDSGTVVSLDLGLTETAVALTAAGALIDHRLISVAMLQRVATGAGRCFEFNGALTPVSVQSDTTGWPRSLMATDEAPTTMVAGFAMHRIVGTTPLADTRAKIRALGRPRGRALDTATGLGYTAIELARTCSSVTTIEVDPAALSLAARNPWSAALFTTPHIEQLVGDACQIVTELPTASFGVVMHDPPAMPLAGELYAGAFYAELRRVLRPGGRLFHYVGDVRSGTGARVAKGVSRRLAEAGFMRVRSEPDAFGISAMVADVRPRRRGGRGRR